MSILVTGATGNVGRPLITRLLREGAQVCAVSRQPETAGLPEGVQVVDSVFDGLSGATSVFLNSRALGVHLAEVVRQARAGAVTRLVALSAINADDDFSRQPSRFRGDRNKETDQLAAESGLEWVSLRPSVFASNFAGMWSAQIRAGDVVNGPYAAASTAPIDETDIAEVAAHALLSDDLLGQRISMTGPQALTNSELVEAIGSVIGRPLRYHEVPPELVRQRFIALGFAADFADSYMAMLSSTTGRPALVTHEVEKILGRPARPFTSWVADHRAQFVD